jgi:multidrug transporter EmrE-like cation transporter
VYALRFGELNTLYPIVSLTFIWVTMISVYVLNESISFSKISGITTIIGGVFLIQRGGK